MQNAEMRKTGETVQHLFLTIRNDASNVLMLHQAPKLALAVSSVSVDSAANYSEARTANTYILSFS